MRSQRANRVWLLVLVAALGGEGSLTVAKAAEDGFARAIGPRKFEFPADHGSHPRFATEWWYLTGHLTTEEGGDLFGFQATWFRRALTPTKVAGRSEIAVRDVMLFHGGLTDVGASRFFSSSRTSRAASTWAGARLGGLEVWVLDDRLENSTEGSWRARFEVEGRQVELRLEPTLAPLLHGEVPGLSQKGPEPGEASYYVSQTRLAVSGRLQRDRGGPFEEVRGRAWFDHEFFSQQLANRMVGWDWFSVALDDGSDLMFFHLRGDDGALAPTSSGTLRRGDEKAHLAQGDFTVEVVATWRAPATGDEQAPVYPAKWRIRVPAEELVLEVEPLVADQEHRGDEPGALAYWEGLCRFTGERAGRPVSGLGYVELVGYRGRGPAGL